MQILPVWLRFQITAVVVKRECSIAKRSEHRHDARRLTSLNGCQRLHARHLSLPQTMGSI